MASAKWHIIGSIRVQCVKNELSRHSSVAKLVQVLNNMVYKMLCCTCTLLKQLYAVLYNRMSQFLARLGIVFVGLYVIC